MGTTLSHEQKAPYCNKMDHQFTFASDYWKPQLNFVMMFSGIVFLIIFLQIFYNKKLQTPPALLIAALCISSTFVCFIGVSRFIACNERGYAEWLFAKTVFFDTSLEN